MWRRSLLITNCFSCLPVRPCGQLRRMDQWRSGPADVSGQFGSVCKRTDGLSPLSSSSLRSNSCIFTPSAACAGPWLWRWRRWFSRTPQTWGRRSEPSGAAWPPGLYTNQRPQTSCKKAVRQFKRASSVECSAVSQSPKTDSLDSVHEQGENVREAPHQAALTTFVLPELLRDHKTGESPFLPRDVSICQPKWHKVTQRFCSTWRRQMDPLTSCLWIMSWSGQWKHSYLHNCYYLELLLLLLSVRGLWRQRRDLSVWSLPSEWSEPSEEDMCWWQRWPWRWLRWQRSQLRKSVTGNKEWRKPRRVSKIYWTQHSGKQRSHLYPNTLPLSLLHLLSPSVLLVPPSSSWPHRTWSAQLGWGPGWETAACRSTALPRPHWIWSERKHLRGAHRGGWGGQKTGKQPRTFKVESVPHQICLCSGSDEGPHSWTLPPEASAECWPPTWEWWGSHSRPLQGQHLGNYTHSLLKDPHGVISHTHTPDITPISRSLAGLDSFGPGIISFFSVLKV